MRRLIKFSVSLLIFTSMVLSTARADGTVCLARVTNGFESVRSIGDNTWLNVAGAVLIPTEAGWVRYDGTRVVAVAGERPTDIWVLGQLDTQAGLLILTDHGVLRYDGSRVVGIEGLTSPAFFRVDSQGRYCLVQMTDFFVTTGCAFPSWKTNVPAKSWDGSMAQSGR
jgi:hypothetical protein